MISRWIRRRSPEQGARLRVLMVCLGNICRSPMAEGVLRGKLAAAGLAGQVMVDSAGTQGYHRGSPPDPRAIERAAARGYDIAGLRARPVADDDFERFDLLLAMDRDNLDNLLRRCPDERRARVRLMLDGIPGAPAGGVPDPYYGSVAGFDHVLDLLEPACDRLVRDLQARLAAVDTGQS